VKKLFAVVVLGSIAVVGCDKPASTTTKAPVKTPVVAPSDTMKGKTDAEKKAADEAKKASDDAKKAEPEKKK
jgi:hypothetical protein